MRFFFHCKQCRREKHCMCKNEIKLEIDKQQVDRDCFGPTRAPPTVLTNQVGHARLCACPPHTRVAISCPSGQMCYFRFCAPLAIPHPLRSLTRSLLFLLLSGSLQLRARRSLSPSRARIRILCSFSSTPRAHLQADSNSHRCRRQAFSVHPLPHLPS